MPSLRDVPSRCIHRGVESGEILAQRSQVERGGPKGKISDLSYTLWMHLGNGLLAYLFNHKVLRDYSELQNYLDRDKGKMDNGGN